MLVFVLFITSPHGLELATLDDVKDHQPRMGFVRTRVVCAYYLARLSETGLGLLHFFIMGNLYVFMGDLQL